MVNTIEVSARFHPNSFSSGATKTLHAYRVPRAMFIIKPPNTRHQRFKPWMLPLSIDSVGLAGAAIAMSYLPFLSSCGAQATGRGCNIEKFKAAEGTDAGISISSGNGDSAPLDSPIDLHSIELRTILRAWPGRDRAERNHWREAIWGRGEWSSLPPDGACSPAGIRYSGLPAAN